MLAVEDADGLLRWRDASIVAVLGERNGGKTTLAVEFYERFAKGVYAGFNFAHSLSLLGFEEKTFQSRAVSGAEMPDTPRTSKQDGLKFFHLAVTGETCGRKDLLISERAGEIYRDVRDNPSLANTITEVRKARTVAFILDGERIADPLRRMEALASVRDLARAFTRAGSISIDCEIQIVTTKWDLLIGPDAAVAKGVLEDFERRFIETYMGKFGEISVFHVAARDPTGTVAAGYGMEPLFKSWLAVRPKAKSPGPEMPQLVNEFDRLLMRG
ncbi:hypothetical protein GT347_10895 [Xylophilus rhododendri]|uniref:Double-GTPase 2 domain-containing protein n=2 Tax=Xylophilus rhododendri TaxID=2697032 RepID=A0A857JFQ1_9BURK|nr:hypothetical protein GT347_10895 [Xylophilus rhododendri]